MIYISSQVCARVEGNLLNLLHCTITRIFIHVVIRSIYTVLVFFCVAWPASRNGDKPCDSRHDTGMSAKRS